MSSTTAVRRPRWHPPPPPTPKILNLPRRTRRKPAKLTGKPSSTSRGKLESLFDQERVFSRTIPIVLLNSSDERRERVEDIEFRNHGGDEDDWRFQTEILRAECNFLRMERDIALKKLELNRVQTKRTLRSAVETLVSGKEKIYKGKSVSLVLEEEIEDLEEKLKELQRNSCGVRDFEFGKFTNFDKQASILQKRLAKLGEESEDIRVEIKTCRNLDQESRFKDVEVLRRKMERLSKGMLERMEEEYWGMISTSSCSESSTTSSASNSRPIAQVQSFLGHNNKETKSSKEGSRSSSKTFCRGRCKKIVRKIVEQVRAEMEQWEQMQEMLERVRKEMEELQCSRDFWQNRALDSDHQIQPLTSSVQEWKQKAKLSENKVTELEKHITELHIELNRLKEEQKKKSTKIPRDVQKEKRVLICRLKENHQGSCTANKNKDWDSCGRGGGGGGDIPRKRSPLHDIQNSSPLLRQNRTSVPFAMSGGVFL